VIRVTVERLTELSLDDKELEELWSALKWVDFNVCIPIEVLKEIYTGKLKVPQDEAKQLENTILKNINSKKNLFGNGFKFSSFHHNIVVPYNINRRKAINKKLRESYNFPQPTLPSLINPDSRYIT
jgi:hypothetical protein